MNASRRRIMRHFPVIVFLIAVLMPGLAHAKRGPAPKVDPVDYQGIRYIPHGDGRRQCVRASDIKSGKALWDVTIFTTFIMPLLEEDVQWVLIKQMFIADGDLIVVAEDGRTYKVDLKTHAVSRLRYRPRDFLIVVMGILVAMVAGFGWRLFVGNRAEAPKDESARTLKQISNS